MKKILEYVIIIVLHSTLLLEVFMAYFLRKEKNKKGTYLQMYESFWDKDRKQPRTRNVKSFGYVEDFGSLTANYSLYKPQALIKTGFQSYFLSNIILFL